MAIVYGTLYMFFAAFPIVYQEKRGWSEGRAMNCWSQPFCSG